MLRTNRSAWAFRLGERAGNFTDFFTPSLDSDTSQQTQKLCGEEWVAIMNEVMLTVEDSVHGVGDPPPDLAHPQAVGGGGDPRHLDLARR